MSFSSSWIVPLFFLLVVINTVRSSRHIDEGPVCGMDFQTYESHSAAQQANVPVRHCGNCGACSNDHDIQIYEKTKNTLTTTTKRCAMASLVFGLSVTKRCMIQFVGFTDNCRDCWMENIACTRKKCTKTCIKYMLLGKGDFVGKLNPCLACDERECGPAFAKCAGANRRRAGIVSDIARPDEEVCTIVDQ